MGTATGLFRTCVGWSAIQDASCLARLDEFFDHTRFNAITARVKRDVAVAICMGKMVYDTLQYGANILCYSCLQGDSDVS